MPEPRGGENREEWLDRCMGDAEAVADFPDADQRFAVCVSKWEKDADMTVEQKSLSLDVKAIGEEGQIEGYGAVFGNRDSYGDIMVKGAFTETLKTRKPKMLYQHNMLDPIGTWDEYFEDERGLYMKGRIAIKTTKGRDAYELVKAGAIDGLSIGYVTKDYAMEGGARLLKEVDLFETSLVTMPANAAALVTNVKNADVRDIEAALRHMNFSRSEAKAMATAAWKRRDDVLREADAIVPEADQREVDELKALLATTLRTIGGQND